MNKFAQLRQSTKPKSESTDGDAVTSEIAFKSKFQKSGKSQRCDHCNKRGHVKANCWSLKKNSDENAKKIVVIIDNPQSKVPLSGNDLRNQINKRKFNTHHDTNVSQMKKVHDKSQQAANSPKFRSVDEFVNPIDNQTTGSAESAKKMKSVICTEFARVSRQNKHDESYKMPLNSKWDVDSGATSHICFDESLFADLDFSQSGIVTTANGDQIDYLAKGSINVKISTADGVIELTLENVLYIPTADGNLLSVNKLTQKGFEVTFRGNDCFVLNGRSCYKLATFRNNMYEIQNVEYCKKTVSVSNLCVHEWHKRLCHRNLNDIRLMKSKGLKIRNFKCSDVCDACLQRKNSKIAISSKI